VKKVLTEAIVVALLGAVMAFGANALSPKGLKLKRDYFPGPARDDSAPGLSGEAMKPSPAASASNTWHALEARLSQKGLKLINKEEALKLYADPRKLQDQIIFIDARDDAHYSAGHIPGAFQFDRYYPEKYFGAVFPACQNAAEIVVYCNGGECEDSELAATMFGESGIAKEKLRVYGGGISEWTKERLPLEKGARNNGETAPASK
jgi:rhodanese-related sulfurtransferase